MTREEILKLEASPELDRLMAERIMGWKEGRDFWVSFEGVVHLKAGEVSPGHVVYRGEPWSPSTDVAAAWEVIRKMLENGWGCEIYSPNNPYALEDADKWFVVFAKSEQLDFRAKAPSAPLAICRAALLAMEATQERRGDRRW